MQKGFDVVNLHGTAGGLIAVSHIGENGNWWIGNQDTGIKAQGDPGPKGDKGDPGDRGPAGPQGEPGADADMSRVEALETMAEKLNEHLGKEYTAQFDLTIPDNEGTVVAAVPVPSGIYLVFGWCRCDEIMTDPGGYWLYVSGADQTVGSNADLRVSGLQNTGIVHYEDGGSIIATVYGVRGKRVNGRLTAVKLK